MEQYLWIGGGTGVAGTGRKCLSGPKALVLESRLGSFCSCLRLISCAREPWRNFHYIHSPDVVQISRSLVMQWNTRRHHDHKDFIWDIQKVLQSLTSVSNLAINETRKKGLDGCRKKQANTHSIGLMGKLLCFCLLYSAHLSNCIFSLDLPLMPTDPAAESSDQWHGDTRTGL
ncbi:hypothetical protein DL93DRAFT_1101717 [Clavulina sp. PMI_390]|nr:hypothetical protein DL93DRAFT_1101717 [Clavulina sp. PMI_390]